MADAKLQIIISAQDNASKVFSQTGKAIAELGQSGKGAGQALGSLAGDALKVATVVGGGLVAGIGAAVNKAADFEAQMSAVKAATGATGPEMQRLGAAALALGSDTDLAGISASDAALAMTELGKGGVSVADQLGGATKGALLLASAGAISVGEASAIATKAMNIFGLQGTDVAHVADLMSAGANKSATDVGQLGAAFNQSAAVAKNAGVNIETLTGTLAFLAQRGMEGSDAGTSLKTAILALQAPTDKAATTMNELGINVRDAEGHMLPFADIADVLKSRLSGLSDAQRDAALKTIFGNDAIRVGIALYEGGGDAIRDWTAKVDDAGNAARTGATLNDNLKGSLGQLGAVFETGLITIGSKFTPIVKTATDELSKLLTSIVQSPEAQKALDDLGNKGAAALKALIDKVKDPAFQQQLKEWGQAALDVGKAIGTLAKTVAEDLGPPLKAAVGWFNGLDEGSKQNVITFGLVAVAAAKYRDELGTMLSIIPRVIAAFAEKAAAKKALTAANDTLAKSAGGTSTAMSGTGAAATVAADAIATTAVVTAAATGVTIAGVAAISAYNDATGRTAQQFAAFNTTQEAAALAIAHGATATNGAVEGFIRYLDMTGQSISSTQELAVAWNAYINNISIAGQNTQMFTLALTTHAQAITDASGGVIGLTADLGDVAKATGPAGTGLLLAAEALGAVATTSHLSSAALLELNTAGDAAQQGMNALAGQMLATDLAIDGARQTSLLYAQAAAVASGDTGEFGTQLGLASGAIIAATNALGAASEKLKELNTTGGQLNSLLGPLQQRWDELNKVTENGTHVTAEQAAEYAALAPYIEFVNGLIGVNKTSTIEATKAAIDAYRASQNAGTSYQDQAAAATAAASKNAALAVSTASVGAVAKIAGEQFDKLHTGISQVPTSLTVSSDFPGLVDGVSHVGALKSAIDSVPKAFTVTASVNIGPAVDSINQLSNMMPHSPAKEGPFKKLPDWAALFESWGPALQSAITAFEGFGSDVAKKGAETASSVSKALTDALTALGALGKFKGGPSTGQMTDFLASLTDFIAQFTTVAADFEEQVLKQSNLFADAAAKASGLVKNAVEGLVAIGKFQAPLGSAVTAFITSLTDFMAQFGAAAGQFEADTLADAARFADAAGKVGASVGNALKGLQDLASADWAKSSPTGSAMGWFTHLTASLVANFAAASKLFAEDALTEASAFADAAGKVGTATGTALAGLKALGTADWATTSPTGSAMGWFTHLVASLTQNFADAAKLFKEQALAEATAFADAAGKVMAVIAPAITALSAISTLVTPPQQAVDNLLAGIRYIVARFGDMATTLSSEGIKKLGDFSAAAGAALGAAKTGIDLFKDFDKLVVPSKEAIDNLVIAIRYVVNQFDVMAQSLATEGIAKLQAFATAAGTALTTAKTGTDLFKDFEKLVIPSQTAIDNLLAGIVYVVVRMGEIADNIGTTGMQKAQAFATGAKNIFDTVKAALDTVHNLAQYKDFPAAALRAIGQGMENAIDEMRGRANQAAALEQNADTFLNRMREAARKTAEGLALMGVATGVGNVAPDAAAAGAALGQGVIDGAADTLGTHSPSTALAEIGRDVVAGLVKGMDEKQQDAAKKAADVASAIAKAVTDTLGALTALGKLDIKTLPGSTQKSAFLGSLADFMERFTTVAGGFEEDVLTAASAFADAAGKAVGIVAGGVTGLMALDTFVAPLGQTVSLFVASLADFMEKFTTATGGFEEDALTQAGTFADAAGKVLGIIGGGVQGLLALATFVAPSKQAVDTFLVTMFYVVDRFGDAAKLLASEGIAKTQAFAEAAGKALGAVATGIDAFLAFKEFAVPSTDAIDQLLGAMRYVVDQFGVLAVSVGKDALARAVSFAEGASKIFAAVKGALDLMQALKSFTDVPTDALQGLVAQAQRLAQEAQLFLATMQAAALTLAEGLRLRDAVAAGGPIPASLLTSGGPAVAGSSAVVNNFYITGNTMLAKDTATQQTLAGIVTTAQTRTIAYSV